MECKFCAQPLNEGDSLCPHCGKDNAEAIALAEEMPTAEEVTAVEEMPAAEEVTEEASAAIPAEEVPAEDISGEAAEEIQSVAEEAQPAEIKPGFRMTPGKLTLTIVGAVVLVALLVALVLKGMGASLSFGGDETVPTDAVMETTPPATIPADGNPDDVTCKGSYTVSDEEIVNLKDVVVATAGEYELTNADLQIYYWLQVQQFLSEYSYYASSLGLDYTQPLDTQLCAMSETAVTWQQYFLEAAISTWQNYQALSAESQEKGFEIDEEIRAQLDAMEAQLETDAVARGFESAQEYMAYNVGRGASIADYVRYLELYYQGYAYFEDLYSQYDPTVEELEAYYDAHAEGYAESGITKDGKFVDVRHILIMPEGADSSTIRSETFPDEAWQTALAEAEALLEQWKSGEATEESFAALANAHSDDGDGVSGGLYTQVTQGQMVEAFDSWIFDEARQCGDVDIVETEFGYHIMYFVDSQPQWQYYAESDYIGEKVSEQVIAATEKYPLSVEYGSIALGFVDMT